MPTKPASSPADLRLHSYQIHNVPDDKVIAMVFKQDDRYVPVVLPEAELRRVMALFAEELGGSQ